MVTKVDQAPVHTKYKTFNQFLMLFFTLYKHTKYIRKEGSYPFPLEMSEALLEKPSLEFRADTLRTNGDKSGSGTGSCLPLAGCFLSNTTESTDEMLDLSDFQDLYRKYRSFINIFQLTWVRIKFS